MGTFLEVFTFQSYRYSEGPSDYFIKLKYSDFSYDIAIVEQAIYQKQMASDLGLIESLKAVGVEIVYPTHDYSMATQFDHSDVEMAVFPFIHGDNLYHLARKYLNFRRA